LYISIVELNLPSNNDISIPKSVCLAVSHFREVFAIPETP